jgi:cellulose synthase/poly-beta-1,6-N-acetylglucosamine synthase-like glycosyltransferase
VTVVAFLFLLISLGLFAQALYSNFLLIYIWDKPGRIDGRDGPESLLPPQLRFTLLVPARHEEQVIAQTIQQVARIDYPPELLEIIIVCERNDCGTIRAARCGIRSVLSPSSPRLRLATFSDGPINKPHGMNKALQIATGDVVGVFDAEDDVQPGILHTVNTILLREPVDVVQGAVQLVNHESRWFSALNCVEYFLWFNSRLHHDALAGAFPLAGNTLFVRRSFLMRAGGWDDRCLTEDADLGFRLSALGARLKVFSSPALATREETPLTVEAFVRQRTRWHQGFIQVLRKGDWLKMPSLRGRILALHTLSHPLTGSLAPLLWPVALFMTLLVKMPIPIVLATYLPLYALFLSMLTVIVGYRLFTEEFGLRFRFSRVVVMAVAFLPFTWLLAVASVRAIMRELRGINGWEKTEHVGSHRAPSPGARIARAPRVPAPALSSRAALTAVAFLPHTWLLALASVRAIVQEMRGIKGWGKPQRVGSHGAPLPDASIARMRQMSSPGPSRGQQEAPELGPGGAS